jgi:hypothetical protein
MSVSLELLTQILADIRISSSLKGEILTRIKESNTSPRTDEDLTSEDSYAFDDEQSFEQEIEEDEDELHHDLSEEQHTYESLIERWFQACTRLDTFSFYFYFLNLQFQQLISHAHTYSRLSIVKLEDNIFLLLLRAWLHWLFDYT